MIDEEERSVTCQDVRLIMPTLLILVFTLLVISTVIPYAFSIAINQLRALQAREAAETTVGDLNFTNYETSTQTDPTQTDPTSTELSL